MLEVCEATSAPSYCREVYRWLIHHYPDSAERLRPALQKIAQAKRKALREAQTTRF
ncbi:hypothetical protein [Chitinimonas koreensis]|uniref:hypothetical protein n=1 Tax=Chitinimonas koreensis TaxID=356302 RepID=UPI000406D1E1|nr:hypothetical protein [Chitinimonas koreensis]QNM94914.1 hypothetical protein H9L41_13390 [Chitinimonas koreensis]